MLNFDFLHLHKPFINNQLIRIALRELTVLFSPDNAKLLSNSIKRIDSFIFHMIKQNFSVFLSNSQEWNPIEGTSDGTTRDDNNWIWKTGQKKKLKAETVEDNTLATSFKFQAIYFEHLTIQVPACPDNEGSDTYVNYF